ncbi:MAG TPA: hypothetical protein DC010_11065 [Psychrobacter sp.]|nr:hypothetical protein [Psychrobacter sp.]HBL97086.1 hypothetical protein [Psychrobacter sp.]
MSKLKNTMNHRVFCFLPFAFWYETFATQIYPLMGFDWYHGWILFMVLHKALCSQFLLGFCLSAEL